MVKIFTLHQKGRQLLDLVPEELKSPTLTGEWEQKLEAIAKRKIKERSIHFGNEELYERNCF